MPYITILFDFVSKIVEVFWKNKKNKDGLQNWCKNCQTEYEKQRKQTLQEMKNEKKY